MYKSKRNYLEYPFTEEDKDNIQDIINKEFDKYLKHTFNSLTDENREKLRRLAVDQFSEFMSELSDNRIRWSLDSKVITIKVQSKSKKFSKQTLETLSKENKNHYRFIQKSNKWESICDRTNSVGISYDEFKKEIYTQIKNAASTAAFYTIASWFTKS